MSKFASSVVSFCVGHWTGRAFWARIAFQTAEEAPKPHIHPTHVTSRPNTQCLPERPNLSDRHALAKCVRLCKFERYSRLGGIAIAARQIRA
jgi:hypothetical protein